MNAHIFKSGFKKNMTCLHNDRSMYFRFIHFTTHTHNNVI